MFSHFLRKVMPFGRWAAPQAAVRTVGKRRWHFAPGAAEAFEPHGPDFDRWLTDGSAVAVKSNPQRTVYRVDLPGGAVYAKHCRITGFRAWAREVLRPAKARLEFENAMALRERGIPAVVPLAWGRPASRWPGESIVVTRAADHAVPFLNFLEHSPLAQRPEMRRRIASALGTFLAKLHDAGVAHPDPHPGNLLFALDGDEPHFTLIDVHAVRIGAPLTWAESRANLILYNRWFQLRASRADRLRFWRAYSRGRNLRDEDERGRAIERATLQSNLRFWAGRVSRWLGNNRYFRKVKAGTVRGVAVRDLPEDVLRIFLQNPDAVFAWPDAVVLKNSRSSNVVALTVPTLHGPLALVFKRFNVRRGIEPLKNLFRPSPALRSWSNGHALRDRWLPTPRPLLVLHRTRFGIPTAGFFLAEMVPNARPAPGSGRAFWLALPRILRAMHDRGVSHHDLKAANILASFDAPVLIDLVGVRLGSCVSFRQRCRELARLNASFLNSPHATRSERLCFLHAYLAAGPRLIQGWKAWWRTIQHFTAAKVLKNRKSGRPLA